MFDKKRILFVDDDPGFRNALQRALRHQQKTWDMTFVTSVDEALVKIGELDFDVIVTDVHMPDKNGFVLLKAVRLNERTKELPVIVLTAAEDEAFKSFALDMGAVDLLQKTAPPEELEARIRSALRLKSYQDQLWSINERLSVLVAERTAELSNMKIEVIWRLAKAAEYRDEQTGNHIVRVGCYCRVLAERLGMSQSFVEEIFLAAPLHDIGKIGTPDEILLKPGRLTPEERHIMERHSELGAEILEAEPKALNNFLDWSLTGSQGRAFGAQNPFLAMAATIALTHHERWDGAGYPKGLKGEEIPIESRITSLVDVYDALGSARPYKEAYPEEMVLNILREESAHHFDPRIHEAFEGCLDEIGAIREQFSDQPTQMMA